MMILLCLRNYKQALWRTQVNDYSLSGLIGRELKDLTVGIIGTGSIGATVIRELSGFGCRIICCSRHENEEVKRFAEYVSLETLYRESDIISLHVALVPETFHMIDSSTLKQMKKGVVLINCARGSLMDMKALIEGIESEQIGALGLDCMEDEEHIVHKDLKTDIFSKPGHGISASVQKCHPHPAHGILHRQRSQKHGGMRCMRPDRDDGGP